MQQSENYPEFKRSATHLLYQIAALKALITLDYAPTATDYEINQAKKLQKESRVLKHLLDDADNVAVNCPINKEFLRLTSMMKKTQRSFNMRPLENKLVYILKDDEQYLSKL